MDLPGHPDEYKQDKKRAGADAPLSDFLKEQEKQYLAQKLAVAQGNIALTARSCGIGIRTLSRKMREYGLDKNSFKQKEPVAETLIMKPIDGKGRFDGRRRSARVW